MRRAALLKVEPGAGAGPAATRSALAADTLTIEVTRVVVDGSVIESDGKTENVQRVLALDPFTLIILKMHVEKFGRERRDFGPDYHRWPGREGRLGGAEQADRARGHAVYLKQYVQTDLEVDL